MARSNPDDDIHLDQVLEKIEGRNVRQKAEGIKGLKAIFSRSYGASNIGILNDKAYHRILEAVFKAIISEKQTYLTATKVPKATSFNRLAACADAAKAVVRVGVTKFRTKTIEAISEHVVQTLTSADGSLFEPISQDYIQILHIVFEGNSTVEYLRTEVWEGVLEFCLTHINQYVTDHEAEPSGLSRSFSGLGSGSLVLSGSALNQHGSIKRQTVEDLLNIVVSLIAAANCPLADNYPTLVDCTVRFLHLPNTSVGQVHQVAFSVLNRVLVFARAELTMFTLSLAETVIPVISRFWQDRLLDKDEMFNSVRDEMLIFLVHVHLHLEKRVRSGGGEDFLLKLETLADVLQADYAQRSGRGQLQSDDLEMIEPGIDLPNAHPFKLQCVRLRPYVFRGERNWTHLQIIGTLERLLHLAHKQTVVENALDDPDTYEQPRKRRKTTQSTIRFFSQLFHGDESAKSACLHTLLFVLHEHQLNLDELSKLLQQLHTCAHDKRSNISAWALLVLSSCAYQENATNIESTDWVQLWQTGARALISATTCRAASVFLHSLLATGLLSFHDIAEDVNAIVTSTDTNGPALLTDSSLYFMSHLLRVRITEVPSANMTTSQHVVRWLFRSWSPESKHFAMHLGIHVTPLAFMTLLHTCLGLERRVAPSPANLPCGIVAQAWQNHINTQTTIRYLLLLADSTIDSVSRNTTLEHTSTPSKPGISDKSHFQLLRKLVGELLLTKFESFQTSWKSFTTDNSMPMSSDVFTCMVYSSIIMLLCLEHFSDRDNQEVQNWTAAFLEFSGNLITHASRADSGEEKDAHVMLDIILQAIQPLLPDCRTNNIAQLSEGSPQLFTLFSLVADACTQRTSSFASIPRTKSLDMMDLDEEDSTQEKKNNAERSRGYLPRQQLALAMSPLSCYLAITGRIVLLSECNKNREIPGMVPPSFFDYILELTKEDFIMSHDVIVNVLNSDLITEDANATKLITHLAELLSSPAFSRCEVVMVLCLDILVALDSRWSKLDGIEESLSEIAAHMYTYFVGKALDKRVVTPEVQKRIVRMLLLLMRVEPEYGIQAVLPSPKATLFKILEKGDISVKFFIGGDLHEIFGYFLLAGHDQLFQDILEILPSDPENMEMMSFRVYILASLASRWSNLLRRCIYHIFEIPGKCANATEHATRCLQDVAIALKLKNSGEILKLFAPQLLFTWAENEMISDLPYEVFGFTTLKAFVKATQDELVGLVTMRGQDDKMDELVNILEVDSKTLLQQSFTKTLAYALGQDAKSARTALANSVSVECQIRSRLGQDVYYKLLNQNFVEIVGLVFSLIDQESDTAKYFRKSKDVVYAAEIFEKIKSHGSSSVVLPPNQQPKFSSKTFYVQITVLCSRTAFIHNVLYTPALVTYMARKLLSSIHPALGSLHSCSVLRKLRILVSLAGDTVLDGYPLEMLLHALRPFLVDAECADDAIGLIKYLLDHGARHLSRNPSFVAGLGLSYLGSLRSFLQSSQSSTTQESQFKSTISAAQAFRIWFGNYLKGYDSPDLQSPSKSSFEAILDAAYDTSRVGNAELDTSESNLLHQLLRDEGESTLLNRSFRKVALGMLCSEFRVPNSFRTDIYGNDELSISHAEVVWKSCQSQPVSPQYMSWAGRVLGRAFAGSGHVHSRLLRESSLGDLEIRSKYMGKRQDSSSHILRILQEFTQEFDDRTAGLAEVALRLILSASDEDSRTEFQNSLSPQLYLASHWAPYQTPPTEMNLESLETATIKDLLAEDAIFRALWLQDLCIGLCQSVPDNYLMLALLPILRAVPDFAERVFPFILHLNLSAAGEKQNVSRKRLSKAFNDWLGKEDITCRHNVRILLNALLYLRTQPILNEKSSADRSNWLEMDYFKAAKAATICGMHKTALLFVEELNTVQVKPSRRSSITADAAKIPVDLLLTIFENIDDPDMYYGVEQPATLDSILARFEYEKDGTKSLAFRGAQYDSHIRARAGSSSADLLSLIKSLDVLNQSGLSHALSQSQQTIGMTTDSLSSTFRTARKLEQWDLPVPPAHQGNEVTIYKALQMIHTATDRQSLTTALNEGLERTMRKLVEKSLSASALHESLQTLASLAEIDEVVSSEGSVEFEELLGRFEKRSFWMNTGRFDDIAPILSTRGTILSMLSREPRLQAITNIPLSDTRVVEIKTALISSKLNRAHNALQESLSLATSMIGLIKPCADIGIQAGVVLQIEAANTLWDQGEMASSIGMLQALDEDYDLEKQTISVSRSNILSQLGYQISVARLERADRIVEKYLKPALKELRGKASGNDAGRVFHQFAVFCDQQLQDPDNLEDLDRLRKLKTDKGNEVKELERMYKNASSTADKARYKSHFRKAETWLKIDAAELQRQSANQDEFLRQCLENYLLSLISSDDHNVNALRFTALWLDHSEDPQCNETVAKHLRNVPSRKFAPLMNQLSSRLQDNQSPFQRLLYGLVLRICQDHPYHGMYHVYASGRNRSDAKDEAAASRTKANTRLSGDLKSSAVAAIWQAISVTNTQYLNLANERDDKYRQSSKFNLDQSRHALKLNDLIGKYSVPPPTLNIPLDPNCKYKRVPKMKQFESQFSIAGGVSAPKIITAVADDGKRYKQLVKGGNDDLRQDAIMEQVFEQVSELLKANRTTRQRNLAIRTYKVLPLSSAAGVIEFVADTVPLHEFLMPAHLKYHPQDYKPNFCRKEISEVQQKPIEQRIAKFRAVTARFNPAMRYFFTENFPDPDQWFASRLAYTRSTAAISILGHVLGLGDRHGHNILLDNKSGEVVHIDLGVAFEMGRILPVPELVPFRLTRDIIDGMGITKTEGVFRRCCEFTLEALRKEVYSIMTILDVLRFDPLYSWSMSPVRLAKFQQEQEAQSAAPQVDVGKPNGNEKPATVNEPGEADRALTVVNKKLSKTLSVTATVNDLINQASDERNLAVLYSGWAAYA